LGLGGWCRRRGGAVLRDVDAKRHERPPLGLGAAKCLEDLGLGGGGKVTVRSPRTSAPGAPVDRPMTRPHGISPYNPLVTTPWSSISMRRSGMGPSTVATLMVASAGASSSCGVWAWTRRVMPAVSSPSLAGGGCLQAKLDRGPGVGGQIGDGDVAERHDELSAAGDLVVELGRGRGGPRAFAGPGARTRPPWRPRRRGWRRA
jgi:hypothetical protein